MGLLYLAALVVSITGMAVLDHRFRLFVFADARRAAVVLPAGVALFLLWDVLGIGLGVFFRGQTSYMTGVLLAPELPVEEVFFLVLLCWLTMNVWAGAGRLLGGRDGHEDHREHGGRGRAEHVGHVGDERDAAGREPGPGAGGGSAGRS